MLTASRCLLISFIASRDEVDFLPGSFCRWYPLGAWSSLFEVKSAECPVFPFPFFRMCVARCAFASYVLPGLYKYSVSVHVPILCLLPFLLRQLLIDFWPPRVLWFCLCGAGRPTARVACVLSFSVPWFLVGDDPLAWLSLCLSRLKCPPRWSSAHQRWACVRCDVPRGATSSWDP